MRKKKSERECLIELVTSVATKAYSCKDSMKSHVERPTTSSPLTGCLPWDNSLILPGSTCGCPCTVFPSKKFLSQKSGNTVAGSLGGMLVICTELSNTAVLKSGGPGEGSQGTTSICCRGLDSKSIYCHSNPGITHVWEGRNLHRASGRFGSKGKV